MPCGRFRVRRCGRVLCREPAPSGSGWAKSQLVWYLIFTQVWWFRSMWCCSVCKFAWNICTFRDSMSKLLLCNSHLDSVLIYFIGHSAIVILVILETIDYPYLCVWFSQEMVNTQVKSTIQWLRGRLSIYLLLGPVSTHLLSIAVLLRWTSSKKRRKPVAKQRLILFKWFQVVPYHRTQIIGYVWSPPTSAAYHHHWFAWEVHCWPHRTTKICFRWLAWIKLALRHSEARSQSMIWHI